MHRSIDNLLLSYAQAESADARVAIDRKVWAQFGTRRSILVLDMSGFSLLTQRHGIVHYLSMVHRMKLVSQPIVENHGGVVVKFEADNCFSCFPTPLQAVRAAIELNVAFASMNVLTTDEQDIHVSIGIDEGEVIMFDGPDFFGNAVNRAHKLGEDVAGPGEIFMSKEAYDLIPPGQPGRASEGIRGTPIEVSISGITINVVRIDY